MKIKTGFAAFCLLTALLAAAGCFSSPSTRFYVLSSLPQDKDTSQGDSLAEGRVVGVGPVDIPGYLNRPQLVTRDGANRVDLAEFDNWSEPLDSAVGRVLTENLTSLLAPKGYTVLAWSGSPEVDYKLWVEVIRLDGDTAGEVALIARWKIVSSENNETIRVGRFHATQAIGGPDMADLVAAQSEALAGLSRAVADMVLTIQ